MGTVSGVVFLMFFEKFRNRRKECLRLQPQPFFRTEFGFLANSIFEAFPGIRKSKDPRILAHGRVRWGSVGGPWGVVSRIRFWTFFGKNKNRPKVCLRLQPQPLFRTEFGFVPNSIFEPLPGGSYATPESHIKRAPGELQKSSLRENQIRSEKVAGPAAADSIFDDLDFFRKTSKNEFLKPPPTGPPRTSPTDLPRRTHPPSSPGEEKERRGYAIITTRDSDTRLQSELQCWAEGLRK